MIQELKEPSHLNCNSTSRWICVLLPALLSSCLGLAPPTDKNSYLSPAHTPTVPTWLTKNSQVYLLPPCLHLLLTMGGSGARHPNTLHPLTIMAVWRRDREATVPATPVLFFSLTLLPAGPQPPPHPSGPSEPLEVFWLLKPALPGPGVRALALLWALGPEPQLQGPRYLSLP